MFDFQFPYFMTEQINKRISRGRKSLINNEEFILKEIRDFKSSKTRINMLMGDAYYNGVQDILKRERLTIGEDGEREVVNNIPNNRIVDNQYRKLVIQKINYILGKSFTLEGNKGICKKLNTVLDSSFMAKLKKVCTDSINCGVGYMYIGYDSKGNIAFNIFKPWEIVPGWSDESHTCLDYAIRFYDAMEYVGKNKKLKKKVEVYDKKGIKRYEVVDGRLIPDNSLGQWKTPHFYIEETPLCWDRLPLIAFKYNEETSLLRNVKTLQDGLNLIISTFQNAMEEDPRNTILVLKNYDGENLGEFRRNLSTYGVVKVRTIDGADGDVDTLNISVNNQNYQCLIDIFKKAIIENGMGYDAKSDIMKGNPNMMNILSMYSDIDLDSSNMECEFRKSLEDVIWFVRNHIANTHKIYSEDNINIVFNKNILINESELIDNCIKSLGLISKESAVAKHPWVKNVAEELKKIEKERSVQVEKDTYRNGDTSREDNRGSEPFDKGNKQSKGRTQKRNTQHKN